MSWKESILTNLSKGNIMPIPTKEMVEANKKKF
jgi:hypothetical protein